MTPPQVKVVECSERWCCQWDDLVPLLGTAEQINLEMTAFAPDQSDWKQCMHCGAVHEYYRYTDAAGSTDWNYRRVEA